MIIVKSGNETRLGLITSPFCAKKWSQLVINFECDLITWRGHIEKKVEEQQYTTLHYSTGNSSSSTYLYYTLSLPSLSRLWWKLSIHTAEVAAILGGSSLPFLHISKFAAAKLAMFQGVKTLIHSHPQSFWTLVVAVKIKICSIQVLAVPL